MFLFTYFSFFYVKTFTVWFWPHILQHEVNTETDTRTAGMNSVAGAEKNPPKNTTVKL